MQGDLKGQFQTGEIFGVFYCHDGLPGHPHRVGQIFLRHFIRIKAQPSDLIGNSGACQRQNPRR